MTRGRGLPAMGGHPMQHMPPGHGGTNPNTDMVVACAAHDLPTATANGFRTYATRTLGIPTAAVAYTKKLNRAQHQGQNTAWKIVFKAAHQCSYWRLAGTPFDARGRPYADATFKWATGWTAYTERMDDIWDNPTPLQPDNTRRALAHHPDADIGAALADLKHTCAAHSFGT